MRKFLTLSIILWAALAKAGITAQADRSREALSFVTKNNAMHEFFFFTLDTVPTITKGVRPIIIRSTKLFDVISFVLPEDNIQAAPIKNPVSDFAPAIQKKKLLKITGNILYDLNYRSRIDTPYAENNVYQHTIQTRIDLLYKDTYPLKLYFTSRFSNSPFFRNYTDFNVRFNPSDFKRIIKQKIIESARQQLAKRTGFLDSLSQVLEKKKLLLASLKRAINNEDAGQKIVEERERAFYKKDNLNRASFADGLKDKVSDSIKEVLDDKLTKLSSGKVERTKSKMDSLSNRYNDYVDSLQSKRKIVDSLEQEVETLTGKYKKLKSASDKDFSDLQSQIEREKDVKQLSDKLQALHLPDSILPKGYKTIAGIQSLNIGRSIADYSELSVKNISITGVQGEYQSGYYYALAVGKVDYRFRDYIVRNHTKSNQYVALIRFGKGTRNGNHVYFTYYTGKRQFFNSAANTQNGNTVPGYNLAGITIEGVYKINQHISVIGEIAKSTIPYYSLDSLQKKQWMNSLGKFSSRSNEAYSLKLISYIPKTQTRFNGNISYVGANFQSFSTFTTSAAQLRWLAKLEQPFFKNKLTVISTIQKNNFSNPFVQTAYNSSSVLMSLQANLHVKRYPTVSIGYFPSYQLTKTGDEYYSESRYYTLMASAGHFYKLGGTQFSSYVVYSRFYNASSDSGFVYYNSKNWLLTQSANWNRFALVVNGSLSDGDGYNLRSIDNTLQISINKIISVGGGMKVVHYSLLSDPRWGYNGNMTLNIPFVGSIQLMFDKGFIPAINKQLADNKTGRLIYYKTF
ncbi:MAG: hypothetical protein QM802_11600 [Agriterribacter sp.]